MQVNQIEELSEFKARNKQAVWIFKLKDDYRRQTSFTGKEFVAQWLHIQPDGMIVIPRNYAWNGCTPKWSFFDLFVFGTPDGIVDIKTCKPKMYYPTLVHDALYQYYPWHSVERKDIDLLFLEMARESEFRLSLLYYTVVRLLGGFVSGKKVLQNQKVTFLG
ncbi:MAG: hypothetical protein HUU38_20380 [Anaerolineales bacterium]|nr:hypothetical protein [Anaerolineales bacterium]